MEYRVPFQNGRVFCTAPRGPGSTAEVAASQMDLVLETHQARAGRDKEIGNESRDESRQLRKCRLSKYLLPKLVGQLCNRGDGSLLQ